MTTRDEIARTIYEACSDAADASWADMVESGQATLYLTQADALIDAGLIPDATTREEWAIVRGTQFAGPFDDDQWNERYTLHEARDKHYPGAKVAHRTVTSYADRVTEWTEVQP